MSNDDLLKQLLPENEQSKLTDKQRKILESAIEVFAEKGFAATSTNEIAKRAGVAEGTIFRHYKTKKELLAAVVTPLLSKMVAPFLLKDFKRDVFEKEYASYSDFLRKLIENRLKFARSHVQLLKILVQEIAFQPEFKAAYIEIFQENIFPLFKSVVTYFKEKGELKDIPEETIIRLTISTIVSTIVTRIIILNDQSLDEEEYVNETIHFMMNGLGSKS
ncbi:TetR/AcrR family transcriptional regulator [Metabacillus herbersteinensis]|uniref:TetR/AcrR family transcriptional regulator n=1 Tax=Metabacillus herbersteinensis TaxID=283816 RepID=A0ABV6GII7_9BACI